MSITFDEKDVRPIGRNAMGVIGIKLDENKITEDGAKFDFEIVETGTTFDFRIEITVRENDNIENMKKIVDIILNGINNGEILFGYKSKRGYGKAKIIESKVKEFNTEDLENLILFTILLMKIIEYVLKMILLKVILKMLSKIILLNIIFM